MPVAVTEKLLNHVSGTTGGIVAVYQRHTYQKEMLEAVTRWESYLDELMREPTAVGERMEESAPRGMQKT